MIAGKAVVFEISFHFLDRAFIDQFTVAKQKSVLGLVKDRQAVGDQDHGGAAVLEKPHRLENPFDRFDIDSQSEPDDGKSQSIDSLSTFRPPLANLSVLYRSTESVRGFLPARSDFMTMTQSVYGNGDNNDGSDDYLLYVIGDSGQCAPIGK